MAIITDPGNRMNYATGIYAVQMLILNETSR